MDTQCIFPCEDGMHLIMAGFASIGYIRGKAGLREQSFESNSLLLAVFKALS